MFHSLARLCGIVSPGLHRRMYFWIALIEAVSHPAVDHTRIRPTSVPGQKHRREQLRIEVLITSVAMSRHVIGVEVHIHQATVDLNHAILQAGGNA